MAFPKLSKSRRMALAIAATGVAVLGLVIHFFIPGSFANLVSDALYTVLVYLVLALFLPHAKRAWLALAAFGISAAIELAQLTGVPEQLAVSFPPSRLLFGTTFSALDLVAYAAGAGVAWFADQAMSARWRAAQPE
ncbi:hypothetical protein JOF48_002384 [Arthrobacter stackebrandtii]|uniref:DUF2809 domain-containing protein n=1 Tax=Arthrobacter stackebrandtii TaxID=272161 RepID=A0ABS4YYP2_9MICC|nr:DUF2809 domain-containing protein [Arthrobacter stackebrandtii]MBP2413585.1 hypothetical protein [Arthrobacter stackebrandtii]